MVNYKRKNNKNHNSKKLRDKKSSILNLSKGKTTEITKKKLKKLLKEEGIPKPLSKTLPPQNDDILERSTSSTVKQNLKIKENQNDKSKNSNNKTQSNLNSSKTTKLPSNLNVSNGKQTKNNSKKIQSDLNSSKSTKLSSNSNVSNLKSNGKQTNTNKQTKSNLNSSKPTKLLSNPNVSNGKQTNGNNNRPKSDTSNVAKSNATLNKSKEKIKLNKNDKKMENIPIKVKTSKPNQRVKDDKLKTNNKSSFIETDLPLNNLKSNSNIEINNSQTGGKLNSNKKRKLPIQLNLQVKKKKKGSLTNGKNNLDQNNDYEVHDEHSNSESDSYIDQFFDVADKNGYAEEENYIDDNLSEDELGTDEDFDEESLINCDLNQENSENDNDDDGLDEEDIDQDDLDEENISQDEDEQDSVDEESLLIDDSNQQYSVDGSTDLSEENIDGSDLSDEGSYQEYSGEEVLSDENKPIVWSSSDSDDNISPPPKGNGMEIIAFNPNKQNDVDFESESDVESDYFDDSYDNSDGSFDDNDNWSSAVSSECSNDSDEDDFNEFESEYDSDDDFDSDDITYNDFMDGQYETNSSDEDYEEEKKYVYVQRGEARTYALNGQQVSFNSEEDAQIIEIPNDNSNNDTDSDSSCPELVPIDMKIINESHNLSNFNETTMTAHETTITPTVDDNNLAATTSMICNVMKNQWEKCPISIFINTNETNELNNISIENIMLNMSSKRISTTTHVPNKATIANSQDNDIDSASLSSNDDLDLDFNNISNIEEQIESEDDFSEYDSSDSNQKSRFTLLEDEESVENNSEDKEIDSDSVSSGYDMDLDFNNISSIKKIDNEDDFTEKELTEFDDSVKSTSILSEDDEEEEEVNENDSIISDSQWFKNEISIQTNAQTEQYLIKTRFFNSLNSRQVLVLLKSPLHFHGSIRAKLIAGHAEIYGYELQLNKPIVANSVRGHSFIYFQPIVSVRSEQNIKNMEEQLDELRSEFLHSDLVDLIKSFDTVNDAILLFERNTKTNAIQMINTYMRQNIFPHIYSMDPTRTNFSTESILHCEFFSKPKLSLRTTTEWFSMTSAMSSVTRCMVIGGKGVGKSTYVRHLINSNLHEYKKMLLIDLDIGQPELFLPQTVSATLVTEPIIGPGYLQNRSPARSYLFGEINVVVSPIKYLKCALRLIEYCKQNKEYENCPWIINTMGYVRGFGLELSLAIIKALKITDLVQIQGRRKLDNFDQILDYEYFKSYEFNIFLNEIIGYEDIPNYQIHVYRSLSAGQALKNHQSWDMTPKDLRFATILSNLGNMLNASSEWITDVKPVCASLDKLSIIVSSDDKVPTDLHSKLINANLVYLCSKSNDNDANTTDNIIECYGIGIVRGVDNVLNNVYLLPAISRELLTKVTILAVCGIPLPTSALLNINDSTDSYIPYVYNTDDFVGSRQVFQITHRPDRSFNGGKRGNNRRGRGGKR